MRSALRLRLAVGSLLILVSTTVGAEPITLDDALRRAANRPAVEIARLEVDATRAFARQAGRRPYSPELSLAVGPRLGGGETLLDAQVMLAQTFELGGKGSARRAVADAEVEVAASEVAVVSHAARVDTWRVFQLALLARERLATAQEAEALAIQVDQATRERQTLGAATQLEANLTTAELGRARHDRLDAERRNDAAIAALATAIGAGADEALEPVGVLEVPPDVTTGPAALRTTALEDRADLRVVRSTVTLAQREAHAFEASRSPDLTVGLSYGFEQDPGASAHVVSLSASLGLPLGTRNQGARDAARVRERRAELEVTRVTTEISREVTVAIGSYQKTREAVLGFDREVNEHLHENLELARESFASGKIDYYEFNVVRRELIANRLAYLDAFAEAIDARSILDLVTGGGVTP
jgi:cobalt-zinc-cadmium efflux system outer membrane protein